MIGRDIDTHTPPTPTHTPLKRLRRKLIIDITSGVFTHDKQIDFKQKGQYFSYQISDKFVINP